MLERRFKSQFRLGLLGISEACHQGFSPGTLASSPPCDFNSVKGAGIAQLVVLGLAATVSRVRNFPVEGIFALELTWVQTPFPQNSFG